MGDFPRTSFFSPIREFLSVTADQSTDAFNALIRDINGRLIAGAPLSIRAADYGIFPNTGVDQSAALQSLIDLASTNPRSEIVFDYGTYIFGVELKNYVQLQGASFGGYGWLPTGVDKRTVFKPPPAGGFVISTPAGGASWASISNIDFSGVGAAVANGGVHFGLNSLWGAIKNCHFDNFADEAIWVEGQIIILEDILAINGLLDRTRAAPSGVVRIEGADNFMSRCEISASLSAQTDANMYCNAIYIGGNNHFINMCVGEISDNGFYISSGNTRFVGCRADLNFGHGFLGGSAIMVGCEALNNSQQTTNTYSGFHTNGAQSGAYVGCYANSFTGKVHKYGFEDTYVNAAPSVRAKYSGCRSNGQGTGIFFCTDSAYNPSFEVGDATVRGTGATPDISAAGIYRPTDAGATTITNFLNGVPGQRLCVFGATTTTIQNNANIVTRSGADITFAANGAREFRLLSGKWYEI